MNKGEEACTALLQVFGNLPEIFEGNRKIINRCDKETQDILHEIELSDNKTTVDGYKLYKALREVRRLRRKCKDENELIEPIVGVLKQYENLRLKLYRVHSQVKEVARKHEERKYAARVREDLTICGNANDEQAREGETG